MLRRADAGESVNFPLTFTLSRWSYLHKHLTISRWVTRPSGLAAFPRWHNQASTLRIVSELRQVLCVAMMLPVQNAGW